MQESNSRSRVVNTPPSMRRRGTGWLMPDVWRQRNGLILNGLNIQDLKYIAEKS
jgi:hypothetical protein